MSQADESLIEQILVGWKDPMAALRNQPGITISGFGELVRDYYSSEMRLSIEFHLEERYLRTHILTREEEAGLTLILQYEESEQLTNLLQAFVQHQERVSSTNFKELVLDLLPHSTEAFVETEEGLRPLMG